MTTQITTKFLSRNTRRFRATLLAIAALLLLTSLVGSAAAQTTESKDRDNPVRITSGEISIRVVPDRELYYVFTAGPGEVTMTFDVLKEQSPSFGNAAITLFDKDAKVIRFKDNRDGLALNSYITNERVINHIRLDRRQEVIMRLRTSGNDPGRFRLRLTGAIDFGQPTPAEIPVQQQDTLFVLLAGGVMHVERNDGTVQQISLSQVRRIVVKP